MDGGPFSYASSPLQISALSYFCVIVLILHFINLFYFVLINFISMFLHLPPLSLYMSVCHLLSYIATTIFPDVCSHICYILFLFTSLYDFIFPFYFYFYSSFTTFISSSYIPCSFHIFPLYICALRCYCLLFIHPHL